MHVLLSSLDPSAKKCVIMDGGPTPLVGCEPGMWLPLKIWCIALLIAMFILDETMKPSLVGGLEHFFPYIWNNHPNWLSYFSEDLKPPIRDDVSLSDPFLVGSWDAFFSDTEAMECLTQATSCCRDRESLTKPWGTHWGWIVSMTMFVHIMKTVKLKICLHNLHIYIHAYIHIDIYIYI